MEKRSMNKEKKIEKRQKINLDSHTKDAIWIPKKRRFSTVWIVPIVALLIGGVLVLKAFRERGVEVEISFKSATGIVANKSIVKYKDIEVGRVLAVDFSEDLSSVIVKVEIKRSLKEYLRDSTKFWIVHAKLGTDSVEGLDTILSGSYIAMYPSKDGEVTRSFRGLKEPPVVVDLSKGVRLRLEAKDRGSIQVGSPVYYRKLKAGSVIGYGLSEDGKFVYIDVFIKEPFSKLIVKRTKFWESSGIRADIGSEGVEIETESLTSILAGGISFGNFSNSASDFISSEKREKVKSGTHFILYRDKKSAKRVKYTKELYFWVHFQGSIRGLKVGAPVEFRGVKIGEVINFFLIGERKNADFKIPVLIKIEPERFSIVGEKDNNSSSGMDMDVLKRLVSKGLRAQLQTMSLLTGELFVNLDFHKNIEDENLTRENGLYVLPTVPAIIETLKSDIQTVLDRLSSIPFKEIGQKLEESIELINRQIIPNISQVAKDTSGLIKESNATIVNIKSDTIPKLNSLISKLDSSVDEAKRGYLDRGSRFNTKMIRLLDEVTKTTKSIKSLMDYLQRHPDAILKGK
jgi:paraquat-inducible protein B